MLDRKYFKTDECYKRQDFLCDEIKVVMAYAINYIESCGKAPLITDTVSTEAEDIALNRQHDQHRRRVAFDLSVLGWTIEFRNQVEAELDKHFAPMAYVTASGKKEIAYCHDNGHGLHFHCAVNAKYKLPEIAQF